jgi:cytochrome c-type biogenesis protein CcmH/NrfG
LSDAGRLKEAEEALHHALRLEPTHLPALHSLAAVYWTRNDFAAASRTWEQLTQLEPDNADNREWLQRARAEQQGP